MGRDNGGWWSTSKAECMMNRLMRGFCACLLSMCAVVSCASRKHSCEAQLVGQVFITKENLFLCPCADKPDFKLVVPGSGAIYPLSVEDYRKYGDNWRMSPGYRERYGSHLDGLHAKVVAVIPAGTHICVKKVARSKSSLGVMAVIWGQVAGRRERVLFDGVFVEVWGDHTLPKADPRYLKPLD